MRFGGASGRIDDEFNPFADDYLGEILEAVAVAWARMKQPKRTESEDQITYRLAGRLLNDPQFGKLPYDIVPQYSTPDIDGRILGRLDLRFKHKNSHRDYFAFESKRLHVTYPGGSFETEYRHYVGDPGMGAFVEGSYSEGLPAAGMLGYVMDAEIAKAWNGLSQRIVAKRTELRLSRELTDSALTHHIRKGHPASRLGETLHSLGTHALRLFHSLVPVI